ncbi:MAG: hypothetical protein RIQ52_373 [Pseudomonadota bacterium]|jgi:chemotaxis protein CheZ
MTQKDAAPSSDAGDMIAHLAVITRNLHESLRALGFDQVLETIVGDIPDVHTRLDYVVKTTQDAADKVLSAVEVITPLQNDIRKTAQTLTQEWEQVLADEPALSDALKLQISRTYEHLATMTDKVDSTNQLALDIMMAQEFQDLTGQVVSKAMTLVQEIEMQLIEMLKQYPHILPRTSLDVALQRTHQPQREEEGPVIEPDVNKGRYSSQDEVDDLLSSLGF